MLVQIHHLHIFLREQIDDARQSGFFDQTETQLRAGLRLRDRSFRDLGLVEQILLGQPVERTHVDLEQRVLLQSLFKHRRLVARQHLSLVDDGDAVT